MAIIQQGASGVSQDVETGHRSARVVMRPTDIGSLGSYSVGLGSGLMAAGLAGGSVVWSLRYGGANKALIRRIVIHANANTTAFAAGVATFNLFIARAFTASDTGGTAWALTGGRMATAMANTGMADTRIASTAALGAGTRTLDASPIATLVAGVPATAATQIINPRTLLWDRPADAWPLVLATNEGLVLLATVPATGTWNFGVDDEWDEVSSFGTALAA